MMRCQLSGNRKETALRMFLIFVSDFVISGNVPALMIILSAPTCSVSTVSMLLTFSAKLSGSSCVFALCHFPLQHFHCLYLSNSHTPGITGWYLIASSYRPPLSTKHKQMHTHTPTPSNTKSGRHMEDGTCTHKYRSK